MWRIFQCEYTCQQNMNTNSKLRRNLSLSPYHISLTSFTKVSDKKAGSISYIKNHETNKSKICSPKFFFTMVTMGNPQPSNKPQRRHPDHATVTSLVSFTKGKGPYTSFFHLEFHTWCYPFKSWVKKFFTDRSFNS